MSQSAGQSANQSGQLSQQSDGSALSQGSQFSQVLVLVADVPILIALRVMYACFYVSGVVCCDTGPFVVR